MIAVTVLAAPSIVSIYMVSDVYAVSEEHGFDFKFGSYGSGDS